MKPKWQLRDVAHGKVMDFNSFTDLQVFILETIDYTVTKDPTDVSDEAKAAVNDMRSAFKQHRIDQGDLQ